MGDDPPRHPCCLSPIRARDVGFTEDGKMYLLRVVVDEDEHPPVIVTAYRTSKIEKYWSVK